MRYQDVAMFDKQLVALACLHDSYKLKNNVYYHDFMSAIVIPKEMIYHKDILLWIQQAQEVYVEECNDYERLYLLKEKSNSFTLIRDVVTFASESNAVVYCNEDMATQYKVHNIKVAVQHINNKIWDQFFGQDVMSVHLKEGFGVQVKKGSPASFTLVKIKGSMNKYEMLALLPRVDFQRASSVFQLGEFRIVMTRPPLSDSIEITAVKPIKQLNLSDYEVPDLEYKKGIVIAGSPGQGKTTFATALANHLAQKASIVKTIESPMDMQLPAQITQLHLNKNHRTIKEVLLLSRPDYCVFDEIRHEADFSLYTELRLAGVGMIGVVHAADGIEALQRIIQKTDLGLVPKLVDTILLIKAGKVAQVFDISIIVKVPSGMKDDDLARPVVEVRVNDHLLYELYSFGDSIVSVPIQKREQNKMKLIQDIAPNATVIAHDTSFIVSSKRPLPNEVRQHILSIDPQVTFESLPVQKIEFSIKIDDRYIILMPNKTMTETFLDLYVDNVFFMQVKTSKQNIIKISLDAKQGQALLAKLRHAHVELCKTI